jgi:hypothetical protein
MFKLKTVTPLGLNTHPFLLSLCHFILLCIVFRVVYICSSLCYGILFFTLREEGASWLRKLEHLKYILAYFILFFESNIGSTRRQTEVRALVLSDGKCAEFGEIFSAL